jgi:hypothetical protein
MPKKTDDSTRDRRTAKRILAVGLPLVLIAGGGVGYAYWTSNGSGTGTASSATSSLVTVTQVSAPSNLAPGIPAGAVSASVSNLGGSSAVKVSQLLVSIAGVTKAAGAPAGTCSASDYAVGGTNPMTAGAATLATSGAAATTTFTGATLSFVDDPAVNQDACKGATVNLSYTAS